jgi:choline-sulfatase
MNRAVLPFLVVCGVVFSEPAAALDRPNVLLIAIDDLNDWVGCLDGHPRVRTPHMDRLALRGTVFLNAHCQSPVCNPSRTSFLTGLRPTTTGVYGLSPWFRSSGKWNDHRTVFQYFREHGYRTMTTGKVFHDAFPPKAQRRDGSEVDEWGFHGSFAPRPPERIVPGLRHRLVDWGVYPERDELQDDWKVADWAIARLKAPPSEPFFLSVGFRHPHVPLFATQKWFDQYSGDDDLLPPVKEDDRWDTPRFSWFLHWKLPEPRLEWIRSQHQWHNKVRAYLASVSFVDAMVGRVLEQLAASGLAERTVVVLLSDHGYHLGEKLISGKNTLWDRSTRVPLIFAGPGVRRRARSSRPAELLDVYPTLAALCGLPAPSGLDGHSLVPQLRDPSAPRPWPAITTHGPDSHGVRNERYRYIRYADGSEELYDMAQDPNEWFNLAAERQHAATKTRLAAMLPESSAPPMLGSRHRVVELRNGVPYWEGKPIGPDDPIPTP